MRAAAIAPTLGLPRRSSAPLSAARASAVGAGLRTELLHHALTDLVAHRALTPILTLRAHSGHGLLDALADLIAHRALNPSLWALTLRPHLGHGLLDALPDLATHRALSALRLLPALGLRLGNVLVELLLKLVQRLAVRPDLLAQLLQLLEMLRGDLFLTLTDDGGVRRSGRGGLRHRGHSDHGQCERTGNTKNDTTHWCTPCPLKKGTLDDPLRADVQRLTRRPIAPDRRFSPEVR